MTAIWTAIKTILLLIPSAIAKILTKVFTAGFMEDALKYLIIKGLEKLAQKTESKVDDELVEKVRKALETE